MIAVCWQDPLVSPSSVVDASQLYNANVMVVLCARNCVPDYVFNFLYPFIMTKAVCFLKRSTPVQ